MQGEESKPTDTAKGEAGAELPEDIGTPAFLADADAGAGGGGVLAPGTSEGGGFAGIHTSGEGKISYPWWQFWK